MTQAPAAVFKIPTESPQPARKAARPARKAKAAPAPRRVLANGAGRTGVFSTGQIGANRTSSRIVLVEP